MKRVLQDELELRHCGLPRLSSTCRLLSLFLALGFWGAGVPAAHASSASRAAPHPTCAVQFSSHLGNIDAYMDDGIGRVVGDSNTLYSNLADFNDLEQTRMLSSRRPDADERGELPGSVQICNMSLGFSLDACQLHQGFPNAPTSAIGSGKRTLKLFWQAPCFNLQASVTRSPEGFLLRKLSDGHARVMLRPPKLRSIANQLSDPTFNT